MNLIDQATKILKKPIGWLELDIEFDLNAWKEESKVVEPYLVHHREGGGHSGWKSCCIHGLDVDKTGHWSLYSPTEDTVHYNWTALSALTPTITNFWKLFPSEKFARLRFMELDASGCVAPHNDAPNGVKNTDFNMMDLIIPINIAIVHPEHCYMEVEGYGSVPFAEGKAFIVNITNTHSVVNNSSFKRMHMIAHCMIGNRKEEFAELVVRSYNKQYGHN